MKLVACDGTGKGKRKFKSFEQFMTEHGFDVNKANDDRTDQEQQLFRIARAAWDYRGEEVEWLEGLIASYYDAQADMAHSAMFRGDRIRPFNLPVN